MSAIFVYFLIVAGLCILIPAWAKIAGREDTRKIFPELYSGSPSERSYRRAYISYFRPFLSMVVAFLVFVLWVTLLPRLANSTYLGLALPVGAGLLGFSWLFFGVRHANTRKQALSILWASVLPNLMSFLWFLFPVLITGVLIDQKLQRLGGLSSFVLIVLCSVFLVGLHFILSASHTVVDAAILWGALCFVVAIFYPGLPYFGGATLRFLGVGGGAPVLILIKTMEPGSTQVTAKEVNGCLLLALGGDVLIAPAEHREQCELVPKFLLGKQTLLRPYDTLERYARSDVLEFSKFTVQDKH